MKLFKFGLCYNEKLLEYRCIVSHVSGMPIYLLVENACGNNIWMVDTYEMAETAMLKKYNIGENHYERPKHQFKPDELNVTMLKIEANTIFK